MEKRGVREPSYWFETWRRATRWQRAVDAALAPWNLSHTRFFLLDLADRLGRKDSFKQRELVKESQLTEGAVSQMVRALEDLDLIERGVNGRSGREWKVRVTSEGRRLLATVRPVVQAVAATFPDE